MKFEINILNYLFALIFTADQRLSCGPLQFKSHSLIYFRAVGLSDPIRCVLKLNMVLAMRLNVQMFRMALSSHINFFAFRDTNRDTLVSLRPEARDVATRVSGRK